MSHPQVLVVENEMIVALDLEVCLKAMGCNVAAVATSGEEAVRSARLLRPDVVLMDIWLDGPVDGIQAAEEIRKENSIPLVFLTAAADIQTIRRAVQVEPSGYLNKPFDERELMAAIQIALHQGKLKQTREIEDQAIALEMSGVAPMQRQAAQANPVIRIGRLTLDPARRRAFQGESEVPLTKKEFDILCCLARRAGLPLSPEALLTEVWGPQFGHYVQTLRVHIGHLRKKLGPASGVLIEAVRGVGYRATEAGALLHLIRQ